MYTSILAGSLDVATARGGAQGQRRTLLIALGALLAATALDLALDAGALLVELLVVAPLVAATGLPPGRTALVAALALVVSIPLGLTGNDFGSAEHLAGVAVVAIGGALAVAIAALRGSSSGAAARLEAQYGVARAIAEARTLDEAAPAVLAAIAEPLDWQVGYLWEPDRDGDIQCAAGWRADGVRADRFDTATRELTLTPGVGLPGQVWESGHATWLRDAPSYEGFRRAEAARIARLRGALVFPITSGERTVGVIELFCRARREPDPELIALTRSLGYQIGEFVERQRVVEAVGESEARKAAVLASALDGVVIMDHRGHVVEWNPAAERIFGRQASDVVGREMAELIVPPSLRAAHRRALARYVETREPSILGRRLELLGMRADGSEFPVEVAINRIGTREPPMFTGTLRDITRRKANEEEREELLRLEQLARVDADQAREQLEAILRGVADAITAQGPDGQLLFANDAAVDMLGFGSSEELLAAPREALLERFDMLSEDGGPFPVEELPGRRALAEGVAGEALVRFRRRATGEERWSAVKATPILDGGGTVAMAINVIEDITTHKRAEMAQRFLADSSALLSASLDPDELLRQVATLAVPEVADWCAVDLRDELGEPERVALAHVDPEVQARGEDLSRRYPPDPRSEQGVPNVLRTGVPELYPEITDEMVRAGAVDDEHYRLISELGMRSAMIVPMKARGRMTGALSFVTGRSGRRFDGTDLRLAEELARRCSTAVDNARLYTERAYIARTLQQSLLPVELPDIPGLDTAARFLPTGEAHLVGGDFYDMFATGGRGWTVVMGDVCGKGPDAAALTALARYTLRAAAARERLPSRSLRLLNEALLTQRDDRRFCTVAYAYIEMLEEGARVGFASGGHPLPLHLRADGWVETVGTPGTLLGVVPDPSFEDRAVALERGDSLVFYTDGVIEGRGDEPSLDEESLAELVATCAGREADAIAAEIEQAAIRGQRGRPRDDIAVLVLRVVP